MSVVLDATTPTKVHPMSVAAPQASIQRSTTGKENFIHIWMMTEIPVPEPLVVIIHSIVSNQ
jgi:hypothetical protein